jgi:hypothetical protein
MDFIQTIDAHRNEPLTKNDIENSIRWACHLHKSDARCEMRIVNNRYYHITQQKDADAYAQVNFNAQQISDEFWEDFGTRLFVSPIAHCSVIDNCQVFIKMSQLFVELDAKHLKFHIKYNTAADFIKRHIICDVTGEIFLCNKHLLRHSSSKKPQEFYKRDIWIRSIIKELFPKITKLKNIPTNTPLWAMHLILPPNAVKLLYEQQQQQQQQKHQEENVENITIDTISNKRKRSTS